MHLPVYDSRLVECGHCIGHPQQRAHRVDGRKWTPAPQLLFESRAIHTLGHQQRVLLVQRGELEHPGEMAMRNAGQWLKSASLLHTEHEQLHRLVGVQDHTRVCRALRGRFWRCFDPVAGEDDGPGLEARR
jgi:hypothetical protein